MKTKLLLLLTGLFLTGTSLLFSQNVSILPGETTTIETAAVYNGDFGPSNTGGSGFSCNFNKGRGVISIGAEVQSNSYASWDDIRVAFYYNGSWFNICQFNMADNQTGCDLTTAPDSKYYTIPVVGCAYTAGNNYETFSTDATYTKIGKMGGVFSNRFQNICIKNNGNLNVYHGNYLPQTGVITNRVKDGDNNMWGIQTASYTATGKIYPAFNDPNPSTKKTTGYDVNNYVQYGNLPGFTYDQYTPKIGVLILNIANLPPDMLESPSFKVHLYALSNGNDHNRIYETTYNNQNFMTNSPLSLVASKDQCGTVKLTWSNSNNVLPEDGTVTLKNVIFRNGVYLATILGTATTYNDNTAVQDVSYSYTVRHVAFSETGETYYRSPSSAVAEGYVKPSPDQPISPTASSNTCNGEIGINWGYNGVNPQYFRLDYSTVLAGPYTTKSSTIAGSARNYNQTGLTRGQQYYYRIYAINSCGVLSTGYAECNGISIADPSLPTSVAATLNATYDTVSVSWTDAANNETKYQIQRQDDLGNLVTYDINPKSGSGTTITYKDFGITACRSYNYSIKVFNDCVQSGLISSSVQVNNIPPPNLNATFTASKKLTGSKGYFSNRIELSWQNNNGQNIDLFKIYRKISGTSFDSTLVGTAATGSGFYVDNTADARVYYKYTILGVKYCNGTDILSNTSEDIGFRNPTGLVNGHIEYNGGIVLTGAKVIIQQAGAITGSSLQFASNETLTMQNASTLGLGNDLRLEFWFKPTSYNASQNIVTKSGVFSFKHIGSNYEAMVNVAGTAYTITVPETNFALNLWRHVSMQYKGASGIFKLYANGVAIGNVAVPNGTVSNVSNQIVIGGTNSTFLMDEFRLIASSVLDTTIYTDHTRFLNSSDPGFKISLRFDENYSNYAYDGSSQSNVFNANHFVKTSGVTWSTDKPSSAQLAYFGVTDALGNYNVSGITFIGTGENFTIIPAYLTHSFSPGSRSVYIGDASTVYNNQDFIDNSSFSVSGTLFYKNTSCPVPDATMKIDGATVIKNGLPVLTDAAGAFTISVPIGNHYISVERFGHYMEAGRFPATGDYNFQAPVSGIAFKDSTKRSIVGRVVGGLNEANKAPGMGRSKNNIGQAKVRIVSPIAGIPCFTAETTTIDSSGEYRFDVPPLEYRVDSVYVIKNKNVLSAHINPSPFTNTNQLIDLRNKIGTTTKIDSVFSSSGTWTGVVDSVTFHIEKNFIYRIAPSVNVSNLNGSVFSGEDSLAFGATKFSIKPSVAPPWGPFVWPVFKQGKRYSAKITGSEIYTNFDSGKKDTVPLEGNVKFTNDLVSGSDPNPVVPMTKGVATYSFTCGEPNNATFALNPALNYTKDIQVVMEPQGAASVTWKPNETISAGFPNYHAIVVGQKITGTGVSTQGPEKVDFILRDPPGSGSSSMWGTGVTVSKSTSYSKGLNQESETTASILLGKSASIGIGYAEKVEVDNSVGLGFSNTYERTKEDTYTETMTNFSTVSTRDDADNVGAPADVFIGRSKNWLVGPTSNIELKTLGACSAGAACFGPTVNGYRMAKTVGYVIAPDGVRTRFSYTQKEIEEVVIPTLESIRSTFLSGNPKYVSHLPASDPLFGINNDDPLLTVRSTTTETIYETKDTTGTSYTYYMGGVLGPIDSVRAINSQIALWKQALARNEREKYECVNGLGGTKVDNFTLGSAIVNNTYSLDQETSSVETYELALGGNTKAEIGLNLGGQGFKVDMSLTLMETRGESSSNGVTQSTSFEYTLTDGDPGDIMSIDVYKSPEGTGNIFITRGGQTMCPYEDAIVLHYYNPNQPNAYIGSHVYKESGFNTIQNATVKREEPNIVITPSFQYSIPSNQPAIYQLILTNQSALSVNNDIDLRVHVASQSNPYGAVVKIDGLDPNTLYTIPTGASVVKTLTVERGPIEINYDSLMIIFSSACSDDIADTAYISAHFIPTCTDLKFTAPSNNWVFNNSISNAANLIVSDYNYNYGAAVDTSTTPDTQLGLTKIGLEFKPGNTSTWTEFKSFYKYPAIGQDTIPSNQIYSQHLWDISSIPDGTYEIKTKSYCLNKDGSFSTIESPVLAGIMDRINPHPFGTPSPADGILDPNDDITLQFNEPIDIGSLTSQNFDVRGVLNGTAIRHAESINFDGINNYLEVSGGANLQKRDFTFEFWAKLNATGIVQTVISQGTDPLQKMAIGFNAANKLTFSFGNTTLASNSALGTLNQWHHYALAYNFAQQAVAMYVDGSLVNSGNTNIYYDYNGSGKLVFGKELPANNNYFNGNIHEVRLWSTTRNVGQIVQNFTTQLNRSQSGLLYNWKMDEADGIVAKDDIRSRNADIYNATWQVSPNGNAVQFDGVDDRIDITAGTIPITKEMDFTLEFWFNSSQGGAATLFSNGKGDGLGADSLYSWNIQKDAGGTIHVYHKGYDFVAASTNYFDGKWHHFALVMQRSANLSCYIDGSLQNSVQATSFEQMGGAKMYLGARGYGVVTTFDNYYNGKMDEFRFWNTARKTEQILRDKQNRLQGNEYGLQAFVPFESYVVNLGVPVLTPSFNDYSTNTLTVAAQNGATLIGQTPTIKLPRPVQAINFTWSLNNDKIIITPTSSPELLENVTLDITVKNAYDHQGNKMQSPKTWIAYINKNQVKWQDHEFNFSKTVDSVITFTAPIVNSGGAQKAFTIGGLPGWMNANITSGNIAPNSTKNIVFTIPAGQSVGNFNADISVTTDFGFNEILRVNVKVNGDSPIWNVNPSSFQYSMNIFGELKIDGVISTNTESRIAAFNNNVLCGVADLKYLATYDRYEVFLNVYSNQITGDSIRFKIYDASTGLTFIDVTPSIMFVENTLAGTVTTPVTFIANTQVALPIQLNAGWTWVSLPLKSSKLSNSNLLMNGMNVTTGDVISSLSAFDQYDSSLGWIGNISGGSGFHNNQSYKIKMAVADTLVHTGAFIHPDSAIATINLQPGWNWIGYVSSKNVSLTEALGNYNPVTGDLIKSQYEFAYYDNLNGWTGSLTFMKPGMGYMLKSSATGSFKYPLSSYFGRSVEGDVEQTTQTIFAFTPEIYDNTMSAIITGNICNEALDQGNVALGAFDQTNALRGYALPVKSANKYNYYLTLYSNSDGENLNLKYFNTSNGSVIPASASILFATNSLAGTPSTPVIANVADSLSCIVVPIATGVNHINNDTDIIAYPNPFSNHLTLKFNRSVNCKLELMDVLGRIVYSSKLDGKKEYDLILEKISSGIYSLHLTGDVNEQIKIVKQ